MEQIVKYLHELMEKSTPEKPVWNMEAILENRPAHWSYIDGCMGIAILYMYEATQEEKYFTFLDNFIDYYVAEDGNILGYELVEYNSDSINEGKLLYALYEKTGKEKYKKALDMLYTQVSWQPRTRSGSFWHKLVYPYQVWLDGLYMVEPFYLEYELRFNEGKNIPDVLNQFSNVVKTMKDEKTGLFYHAYDESRNNFWANKTTGLSENFWLRSLGWYAMSIIDTIDLFQRFNQDVPEDLVNDFKGLMKALLNVQDPASKLFYQVPNLPEEKGNYLETSGSCAVAYSLMKGSRLNILDTTSYDQGLEILEQVVKEKLVIENGQFALNDICLVAGLGGMNGKGDYKVRDGSLAYYFSEPKVQNDAKGVAPFIYAYTEILRHGK